MQLHRLHSSSRVRFAITLMAAMVLGATGLMAATTYYVSPLGDDLNNDGKSEGQAFKTPAKALAVASTSDEIVVLTGDYQLTAELAISKAVTLRGVDRNSVILRAAAGKRAVFISVAGAVLSTVTVTDGSGDYKGANVYMTVASTVTNCVLRNGFSNNNGNGGAGIWLEAGLVTDTVITNNGIGATSNSHTGGALHIKGTAVAERCLVAFNTAECRGDALAGPAGVLVNSTTAIVRDCTIVENVGQAIGGIRFEAQGLVTNSIIAGNTAYRNAAPAGTYQGNHKFRNCALDVEGLYAATFTNYTGIIDFVDPAADDWRPRLTSVAYRGGDASGAFKRLPAGSPACDLSAVVKAGLAPFDAAFVAATEAFGTETLSYTWHFGDGSAPLVTTAPSAAHTYANPGHYTVSLYVTGGTSTASVTYASEIRAVAPVIHVTDVNPDAALPYDSWNCAATNLQAAMDEAVDGCTILIDNVALPIRDATSVKVLKGVTIRDRDDDPSRAAIGRYGTTAKFRLLELNHADAVISGVAFENGYLEETYGVGGNLRINKAGGTVTNCIIRNGTMLNQGSGGAGLAMYAGRLTHSVVSNNYARGQSDIRHTGAIDLLGGVVDSCLVTGNRSDGSNASYYPDVAGVNVAGGSLRNSTIVKNTAKTCGGVWIRESAAGSAVNCIVADNTSTGMPVPFNDFAGTLSLFSSCATTVEIPGAGAGCVHGNLAFVGAPDGDFTPTVGSVAVGNGLIEAWMAAGRDLAGNPRLGDDAGVDIGAYERIPSGFEASMIADSVSGAEPFTVSFIVSVAGAAGAVSYDWDFAGTGIGTTTTSTGQASFTYTQTGSYTPSVTVTDALGNHTTATLQEAINVAQGRIYVVPDPAFTGSEAPYSSWNTAATNIHDAIAVAGTGSRIILRKGDYPIVVQVSLTEGATIQSETGVPKDVVIRRGKSTQLCLAVLNHPRAGFSGLTVADGLTEYSDGANIYVKSLGGTVSNCVIRNGRITNGNDVRGSGIRLDGGLVTHCVITGNVMRARGSNHTGGALGLHNYAVADTCLVAHNVGSSTTGTDVNSPIHLAGGTVRNCTVVDNVSSNGYGAIYYYKTGNTLGVPVLIVNSLFADNESLSSVVRAGLANNDALNLMQNCASDIDPSSTYASKCFHGELPFKNPARGDYRPVVPSIAIGTAALTGPILAGARDLHGVTFLKPSGTADIGAYAFTGFQSTLLMIR